MLPVTWEFSASLRWLNGSLLHPQGSGEEPDRGWPQNLGLKVLYTLHVRRGGERGGFWMYTFKYFSILCRKKSIPNRIQFLFDFSWNSLVSWSTNHHEYLPPIQPVTDSAWDLRSTTTGSEGGWSLRTIKGGVCSYHALCVIISSLIGPCSY